MTDLSKDDFNMIDKCTNSELIPVLRRLLEYKKYFSLLKSETDTYKKIYDCIGDMPNQLKGWFNLFNGGLLFDISMFSTRDKEKGKFNRILTFAEVNSPEFKKENGIPEEIACFAMTNYGDYYCYSKERNDECIYQWDAEECSIVLKWDSLSEWLDEQIDFAVSLIQDGLLNPINA